MTQVGLSRWRQPWKVCAATAGFVLGLAAPVRAQRVVNLTLESAVEMAMGDSYRVRRLRMDVERTQRLLEAQRAGLKSRVYMTFEAPQFERISEPRWNSVTQRNEIVRENSRRWQMDLTVEQPVILLGYPTNGFLSLNNRVYRYTQITEDENDVSYYNRYFVQYRQPFFQPNWLKNNLENAQLDLKRSALSFQTDAVAILDDIADDYHNLFRLSYRGVISEALVANLERASTAASERAAADSSRAIEVSQVQVALANAAEDLQKARGDYRLAASRMKQRLRLSDADSLMVEPSLKVTPIEVDLEEAVRYGTTLRPQLRNLDIQRRKDEMDLASTAGSNGFRMDVALTYGREMEDPMLRRLMDDPSNSYTVGVRGSLPIWDWGAKRARVEAERLSLERTRLSIEETEEQIRTEIRNVVRNLGEYQQRAQNMDANLALARDVSAMSLAQYSEGRITMLDLLQAFERQEDTAENFLEAYLGYRNAALNLKQQTYYDFETDTPLLDRLGIRTAAVTE